jgi:DNA-directed RNA polymerase subunit RPC12/RpoP
MALISDKPGKEIKFCPICGKRTNFNYYKQEYNEFCSEHSKEARAKASKKNIEDGKFNPGWKKGLTKNDHEGIARQAEKISGENNPFYGKHYIHSRNVPILSEEKFTERLSREDLQFLGTYKNYEKRIAKTLEFRCTSCQKQFLLSLDSYERGVGCPDCRSKLHSKKETSKRATVES